MSGGRLTGSRSSGQHHNLRRCRLPYGICLYLIVGHPCFLLYDVHIYREIGISCLFPRLQESLVKPVTRRHRNQLLQLASHSCLRIIERRQINRNHGIALIIYLGNLLLSDQFFLPEHLIHSHDNRFRRCLQEFRCLIDQLLFLRIHISIIGKLRKSIHQTASKSHIRFFAKSQFLCNLVGGPESNAPDIICQLIRILFHNRNTVISVLLINLCRKRRAYLVLLKKQHDILDFLLPLPGLGYHLHPFSSNAFHLNQKFHIVLDYSESVYSELLHDSLCKLRPHTLNQAGTQILLHTINRCRQGFFPVLCHELPSIFSIDLPVSFYKKHGTHIGIQQIPDYRNKIAVILHPALQDRITIFWILICNSFYYTPDLDHYGCPLLNRNFDSIVK